MDLGQEPFAEIVARLKVLEDERDLRRLLAQYAFYADTGRSRDWVALFTADGAIDLGDTVHSMSGAAAPDGYPSRARFVGHEALLLDFITALPHRRVERRSAHHTTSGPITFDIDGDDAIAVGYSVLIARDPDGFHVEMAAFNRWTFRCESGRWLIAERKMRPIGSAEAIGILEGSSGE
ncbi:nuclear transport factor 2 family protein [Jatrophihabitans sp. GAS493]|uniref:nuclear transport factor 2 family protein n=1 Tax=Jatrophihabitans sp. GAS493 TaxID=1907575 RepID=UPI0012FD9D4A|nr:nuclear transport factor 2 family protein [Jatrophihabitans sp. GAS493]